MSDTATAPLAPPHFRLPMSPTCVWHVFDAACDFRKQQLRTVGQDRDADLLLALLLSTNPYLHLAQIPGTPLDEDKMYQYQDVAPDTNHLGLDIGDYRDLPRAMRGAIRARRYELLQEASYGPDRLIHLLECAITWSGLGYQPPADPTFRRPTGNCRRRSRVKPKAE